MSRLARFLGLAGYVMACGLSGQYSVRAQAPAAPPAPTVWQPPAGPAQSAAAVLDPVMQGLLKRFGSPGASLAIAQHGQIVFARGYGLADVPSNRPVLADTRFILASVSKVVTAQAIFQLVQDGKVHLADRVYPTYFPDLQPPPGQTMDPRYPSITVYDLLVHAGGWDRQTSGDPATFTDRVCQALGVSAPITPRQLMTYMLGQPLDFTPGTKQVYSNFGYIILGTIVTKVSGETYEKFCLDRVVTPAGITDMLTDRDQTYLPGQAMRYGPAGQPVIPDREPPMVDAAGGWIASAPDLVRLLSCIDGSRPPALLTPATYQLMLAPPQPPLQIRSNGCWFGLGWDRVEPTPYGLTYGKNGGLTGTHTYLQHLAIGFDIAILFNGVSGSIQDGDDEVQVAYMQIDQAIRQHAITWAAPTP
jgi:N-acyl-D-amino-acid deacylase